MRVDVSTTDKEHLDYACILIATSTLDIINAETNVMIDEAVVTIKIVEEWGFSIGEDVCLFEEDSVSDTHENGEDHGDLAVNNDGKVDDLVDNLVNDISNDFMVDGGILQNQELDGEWYY